MRVDDGWQRFDFGVPGSVQPLITFSTTVPVVVSITDANCVGDRFLLRDFDVLLAQSSIPPVPASCGSLFEANPEPAFSSGYFAAGLVLLSAGAHELSVTATLSPFGKGAGFVRVDSCTQFLRDPGTLVGTPGHDTLCGTGGQDTILGGAGDDRIAAGNGADRVRAGAGQDAVTGDADVDTIYGDLGRDRLFGGPGSDLVAGGADGDAISGDGDRDRILGEGGVDVLLGEGREDSLFGGPGDDLLNGGQHLDQVDGGPGSDRCLEAGRDRRVGCEQTS